MSKYLVQISPDPFDFIVADDSNIEQTRQGAYYVGEQDEHKPQGEEQGSAAFSSKDGSYTHYCDICGAYID